MTSSRSTQVAWRHGAVVLGGGNFGGIGGNLDFLGKGLDEETSFAAMDEAASLGITLFDTAERYAAGESERIIGRWLASRPSEVTGPIRISTKVGPPWLDGRKGKFDSDYIRQVFGGSLDRLGVESVDVLYTHAPDDHPFSPDAYEPVPIEVTLEALEDVRSSGQTRLVGASNINLQQLSTAMEAADRIGVAGYQVIQNGFNLLHPQEDSELRKLARSSGIAYTAFSALASGVLTGKYRRDEPPPTGSLVDLGFLDGIPDDVYDAVDKLRSEARDRRSVPGALALAWLIAHDDVTALTTAPSRTAPHLSLVSEATDLPVTTEDLGRWSSWFEDVE